MAYQCFPQVENSLVMVGDTVCDAACDGTLHVAAWHETAWCVTGIKNTSHVYNDIY